MLSGIVVHTLKDGKLVIGYGPPVAKIITIGILCKHLSAMLKSLRDSTAVKGPSGKTLRCKRTMNDMFIRFYRP